MSKIKNDKYYTPVWIANQCWNTLVDVIGEPSQVLTEIVEPSVGNGSFLHYDIKPNICFDIEPQCESSEWYTVEKQDFLTCDLTYLKGRLIIGNPPYGERNNLTLKFFKKSIELADYVAFILPISQLNNTASLYEFDLIYSEDLGVHTFTDRKLHCCFNIYKRPLNDVLNKKPIQRLKDVTIYRHTTPNYESLPFDLRISYWGRNCGKVLNDDEHYSSEYKIKVNNPIYKEKVVDILSHYDWKPQLKTISMRCIKKFDIVNLLKEKIDGIQ